MEQAFIIVWLPRTSQISSQQMLVFYLPSSEDEKAESALAERGYTIVYISVEQAIEPETLWLEGRDLTNSTKHRKSHKCSYSRSVRDWTGTLWLEGRDLTNCTNHKKITQIFKSQQSPGSNPGPCVWKVEILPTVPTIRISHKCSNLSRAGDQTQELVVGR